MKKIVLTAAALLIASGSAFAGSDHYGSTADQQQPAATVDNSHTASIRTNNAKPDQTPNGGERTLWGN